MHNTSDVRQIEVNTAEPLVPGTSRIEPEIAITKLKKYQSPGTDEIPAGLIQVGGKILLSAIHNIINSVWNKKELPDQWKESIIVPVHEKGVRMDCNNYCGISLLLTSHNILSNILISRLSSYIDEVIGDLQCGFRHNRSTTDQIFYIRQILEKKWEYNETVHLLFIDFIDYSVEGSFVIEFGVLMKLVRLIKMCLNETYSKVRIGKHLSDSFPMQNGLKLGDALSSLLFNFTLSMPLGRSRKSRWD
jgi:hypothetical protein